MVRLVLSDYQWEIIKPLLPGRVGYPGGRAVDNRLFIEAALWIGRTCAPWRDLPEIFGRWNSVFQRYRRWCKSGVWEKVFRALCQDPDFEYAMVDSTVIRAHQHAAGARGARSSRTWQERRRI